MQQPPKGSRGDPSGHPPNLPLAQSLAEADQIASGADQAAADADQIASGSDQRSATSDQASADRDQSLSAADQRASDTDQRTAEQVAADAAHPDDSGRLRRAHQATRRQREQTTAERARVALERTQAAQSRFQAAERRDAAARARDKAAEARDLAAAARDRDLAPSSPHDDVGAPVNAARAEAARQRELAAADREHAAGDRWETRLDRDELHRALSEAQLDALTGTYGPVVGTGALRHEVARALRMDLPLVIACLAVNQPGTSPGAPGAGERDTLLLDVVHCMRAQLRSYDPVVRMERDRFVAALPGASVDTAAVRFAAVSVTLAQCHPGASFSVGFASIKPGDTLEHMLERGQSALRDAKRFE